MKDVPKSLLENIKQLTKDNKTPFYLYDSKSIVENAEKFQKAISILGENSKNYFAVKALPNPKIVELLKNIGMGFDCSSMPELKIVQGLGVAGDNIFFTSNNTPIEEYELAYELDAIINLDNTEHIDLLKEHNLIPKKLSIRYNPGNLKEGNAIIGHPEESKFGVTKEQVISGFEKAASYGVEVFGIHTMVASNELNESYFAETARLLFDLAKEIERKGIKISFINLGGGFGIPYKDEDKLNYETIFSSIKNEYQESGLKDIDIVTENGRVITGPYGYLVTKVRSLKTSYKNYAGVDATMANLMRQGMYGAYHYISVLNKNGEAKKYDIVGGLCENNDKFAIDRMLPELEIGDTLVIHDTGAHAHSMGFNYNGKLRSGEFLCDENNCSLIRRAETLDDYFSTLNL